MRGCRDGFSFPCGSLPLQEFSPLWVVGLVQCRGFPGPFGLRHHVFGQEGGQLLLARLLFCMRLASS